MNMMVIEFKMEMIIVKVEFDGVYGLCKQWVVEVVKFFNIVEIVEFNVQVVKLWFELEVVLCDLEDIIKESINFEKEKLDLESQLDDVVVVKVRLE